jgi:hypothetical protein
MRKRVPITVETPQPAKPKGPPAAQPLADRVNDIDEDVLQNLDYGVSHFAAPEDLLDKDDPNNDSYFQILENYRSHLTVAAGKLRPKMVAAARLHVQGKTNKEVQAATGYASVSPLWARDDVQRFIALLRRVNSYTDGPNLAVRLNMLWRIAHTNEKDDPSIALQALKELNKVDGAYPTGSDNAPSQVTIIINQDTLPKTILDATTVPTQE